MSRFEETFRKTVEAVDLGVLEPLEYNGPWIVESGIPRHKAAVWVAQRLTVFDEIPVLAVSASLWGIEEIHDRGKWYAGFLHPEEAGRAQAPETLLDAAELGTGKLQWISELVMKSSFKD